MKKELFSRTLTASLVALGMMLAASARAESVPQVIQVLRVEGRAQYSTDGSKTWQTLHQGDILEAGAVVRTSEKSLVDLVFSDKNKDVSATKVSVPTGSSGGAGGGGGGGAGYTPEEQKANIVRVFESTMLGIDKLTVDRTGVDEVSETQLDLRAGQVMGNVKKLSSQSRYEIKIPNGVAGIRGTAYLISSSGRIDVLDGSVVAVIVAADGSMTRRMIPAGSSFDPNTGLVSPMPPERMDALKVILVELPPQSHAPGRVIQNDHVIIFISPVDGTTPH